MKRRAFLETSAAIAAGAFFPQRFLATDFLDKASLPFVLKDITGQAGVDFRHNSGAYGGKLLPETLGSGCAFLDYDADGYPDILLVNSMDWPGHKRGRSMFP